MPAPEAATSAAIARGHAEARLVDRGLTDPALASALAELIAERIGHACERRGVPWIRVINRRRAPGVVAEGLVDRVLATAGPRGWPAARPELMSGI
jgi:hypothetical protein